MVTLDYIVFQFAQLKMLWRELWKFRENLFLDEIGKLMNQIYENKFHMLNIIGESKVTGGATEKMPVV